MSVNAIFQYWRALGHFFYLLKSAPFNAQSKFIRESARFPFTAVGDINTYSVFAETVDKLISSSGQAGIIIPAQIATDDTCKKFFGYVMLSERLKCLIGFRNLKLIFSDVHDSVKFCLFVLRGNKVKLEKPEFVWLAVTTQEANDPKKSITLSYEDLELINPNTLTCPIFRTAVDAELTKKIYQKVPVLENESTGKNPWGISFMRMFDMSNDSGLFASEPEEGLLPLYEAKMFWHYNHRYGDYADYPEEARTSSLPDIPDERLADTTYNITPRYWVDRSSIERRLEGWSKEWILSFRDITNATNERTSIFSLLPMSAVGNNAPIIFIDKSKAAIASCLLANFCSLVFDFVTRHKVGGTHMNFFIVKQLPVLPPDQYCRADLDFIVPRALELTYTTWKMQPFALDMDYDGDPFVWHPERRAILQADLDAYYAYLYGLNRDELRYILDPTDIYGPDFPSETFRVLKNNEIRNFGEYRTQRLVLEAWDRLFEGSG